MIRWFGNRHEKPEEGGRRILPEKGPLAVSLGNALDIDFLSLEAALIGQEPAMGLPRSGPFIVTGYGEVRLDEGTTLSRYYDDQHRMIQVMSSGEVGAAIDDISFYMPWDSVVPAGSTEWDRWIGHNGMIGNPRYDADGILFHRFWSEGEERAEPVQFVETVESVDGTRKIHQTCMLYARQLGEEREMLLIGVEKALDEYNRPSSGSVEFLVGYGLSPADVKRI